ncbi:MAG: carboxypeptidase regulatory-like domain-containing protein [Pyrinomonadaceae bacterium]
MQVKAIILAIFLLWGQAALANFANSTGIDFIYDSLNRLVEVRYTDKVIHYTYDDAGNRTGMSVEILIVAPAISNLSPRGAIASGNGFTLKVFGSNFSNTSVVQWNGSDRMTTFINPNELQTAIGPGDIAAIGSASVVVVNPTPSLAPSNAASFLIVQNGAVSGRVTSGGNGLANVAINLSGPETGSVTTDANGNFNIAVLNNGIYSLTPEKPGYTFTPANRNVNYAGVSQSNLDFAGTLLTSPVNISGRVLADGGRSNHIVVVTITDSNGFIRYTRTNPVGVYRFVDLPRGGNYTIGVLPKGRLSYAPVLVTANDNLIDVNLSPIP